jgi:Acyclic terpene utilisation family protein AtuA
VTDRRPVRIANCSGFYGDRFSAAREMVNGGPIDVLTGDYLAELTMLILGRARRHDPGAGYATTFLSQLDGVLATCVDRGIRIVSNAGGLNPAGLAGRIAELADQLGIPVRVAYVHGDDLSDRMDEIAGAGEPLAHLDTGQPLAAAGVHPVTANAYLGGWGIAEALARDADVVVCGRVTDASLVVGPAAWWHGWSRREFDPLAGAVVAGHVIECGAQATGGNFSWLEEIVDRRPLGFPIAEVAADGSSVITKHRGTGGLVSVDTVTAQLVYEIAGPDYLNPDVVAELDTIRLDPDGPDRVRISGTRGRPPTSTLKVAVNYRAGYRNTMTFVLTGLDIAAKAAWVEQQLFERLGGRDRFADVDVRLMRYDRADPATEAQATAHLQVTVKDGDPQRVGRTFSTAAVELALASYAGFHTTTPPTSESAFGGFWPALVPAVLVAHRVTLPDGTTRVIPPTQPGDDPPWAAGPATAPGGALAAGPVVRVPLGRIAGARSGDKGGNANVGVWVKRDAEYSWLQGFLTTQRMRALVPEIGSLAIDRYELPNLRAVNFVIKGWLGDGVAGATRPDPQAKALGEYLRSLVVDVPAELLGPQ